MENQMFCFQCEQTAGCTGCVGKAGVCGKTAKTAKLQDELTGALIGLARAAYKGSASTEFTYKILIEGLFTTITNVNFNDETIRELLEQVHAEKDKLLLCGCADDYDMRKLWEADEDIRSLKSLILFGIRGVAAYAYHAMALGYMDEELNRFFGKALSAIGEDWGMEELLPIVLEVGKYNLTCMI